MLQGTIDRIEESIAVIAFPDGQKLNISIGKLPPGCRPGDVLVFSLTKDSATTAEKQVGAEDVLNEILNGN